MKNLKPGKLDFYIIKKFLGSYIYSIALIIIIAVVFDFSEKIDDFIEKDAPAKAIIFDYYLNFIPYFTVLFSSLFTFIAVLFFTSRLAARTEIIAMLSSGISFKRLLWPYLISAFAITIFTYYLYDFVIPNATKIRLEFEERYVHNAPINYDEKNIHKQIEPGIYIYMESYSNYSNTGFRFAMEKFDENKKLISKLMSDHISWDSTKMKWTINDYYIRSYIGDSETIVKGQTIDTSLIITPIDFRRRNNAVEAMDHKELNEFIAEQKLQGSSMVVMSLIEKHKRTAVPFSTFILTIIGFSLSSKKVRGGIGMNIGLGLALSFSYIVAMQFTAQFAIGEGLNPLLAIWIPNILYSFIAFYLYKKAPK